MLINQFKTELYNNGYSGDFHNDYSTRLINATDNSIYEVMPLAVAQPKTTDDIYTLVKTANLEIFVGLSLTARGGGTGTNGQSLSNGIVVDLSRYMNKIIDFDPVGATVTVQPGVILSDLNSYLQPHGLFFAPHVSTANRATIGGMIATDAAGRGSLMYGKTVDSLISLKVILADGSMIDTQSVAVSNLTNDKKAGGAPGGNYTEHLCLDELHYKGNSSVLRDRLTNIYTSIINWLEPVQDEINQRFPPLKRPLSGYNIKRCYHNGVIDLTPLFAGSEGTLGIVAAAKLKLLPIPKYKTLVVVHYSSFIDALKDARNLIKYLPVSIEALDEKIQKSAQTLPVWPTLSKWLNSEDKNYISNFVEFVSNDSQELAATITKLNMDLQQRNANYVVITDEEQISQLWSIRSLAVGLSGKISGVGKPVAFVEDAIVPPENLANFIEDLQQLLEQENLHYAMYGHVDVGCIHVRPALNLQLEEHRQKIRPITEMVIKLLNKYNGILWGEHGKGFRGEFVPEVFGPVLYPILCRIKQLFDPSNRLNPGKLAAPTPDIKLERIERVSMRGEFDAVISIDQQENFAASMLCNGNAACFNQEVPNVMCPSYKVTHDRIHSPKGRAMLVKQWLRESSKASDGNDRQIAEMALAALNGCLGCKGCAGKCPTQVDIPDLRTKFLNNYHRQYKIRSLRDLALGYIENLLPIFAKFPRIWNLVHKFNLAPELGLKNVPLFKSMLSLKRHLKILNVPVYTTKEQIKRMDDKTIVIFVDVFTGLLDTEVLTATIQTLRTMNYVPYVIYPRASGKSLIVGGFIDKFRANTKGLTKLFNPLFAANIPLIGLENTIVLMFRDEVTKFATPFRGKVQTLAELLSSKITQLKSTSMYNSNVQIDSPPKYKLLPHCTEQAILPAEARLWKMIFNELDLELEIQNTGCCGMAGSYGYQAEHQVHSKKLFAMHWQQPVNDNVLQVLATGFSCRCQASKQADKIISHPIQIISNILSRNEEWYR